jgi:PadR family transcriptional regulator PadR
MADPNVELLQGTLDLLILKALSLGPLHGWAIAKRIQQMSRDVLTVNQGSLYPALYRLVDRGLISSEPGVSPEGRKITLYQQTAAGKRQLADRIESWEAFAAAMRNVIRYV